MTKYKNSHYKHKDMLIRLFFGIPLSKRLEKIHEYPLTVAIFQRKEYLGIYSPA
ncbi:hypothetical protein CP8484711_0258, partial [Chlamydia psittaci 84-8471/1]